MPEGIRKRSAAASIVLLAIFGLGGLAWLLATKPVFGSVEKTWICSWCAEQRSEKVRQIFDLPGSPGTNVFVNEIATLLSRGRAPCSHEWIFTQDVKDDVVLRPFPLGQTFIHLLVDLNGITDQPTFAEALKLLADRDIQDARNSWHRLLAFQAARGTQKVQDLKQMLGAKRPAREVAEWLKALPGEPPRFR